MTLKLKIVAGGHGFLFADEGKEVGIVDAVDRSPTRLEDFKILVEAIEGEEYSTPPYDRPFGVDNLASPISFGYTTEQIKEMLKKEQEKGTPVEEFYKTLKVGDVVKVVGEKSVFNPRYDATVKVTRLHDRFMGDYGFDAELLTGLVEAGPCASIGAEVTVGSTALKTGRVVVSPVENNAVNIAQDMVNSPNHYVLFEGVEVKDVVKEVLRRWQDESAVEMSFNQAGMMKEALQYLLRAPKKNKKEDVEKAVYYLNSILEEWNE